MYRHFFKRLLDFCTALSLLVVLSPVLLLVSLVLLVANDGAGVFFFQKRPGRNAVLFTLMKFKTMTDIRNEQKELLPDRERFTRVGRWIRSSSLDELPQLINVLKGDMALIGPRPLMPQFLPLYSERQKRRHEVRPGITGWAQVNGRNQMKLSEKFEYDVQYVEQYRFLLDLKIAFKTVRNVILRKNIGLGAEEMSQVDDLGFAEKLRLNANDSVWTNS